MSLGGALFTWLFESFVCVLISESNFETSFARTLHQSLTESHSRHNSIFAIRFRLTFGLIYLAKIWTWKSSICSCCKSNFPFLMRRLCVSLKIALVVLTTFISQTGIFAFNILLVVQSYAEGCFTFTNIPIEAVVTLK